MQPCEACRTEPWWNAMSSLKNTEYGMGAESKRLLMWSWSLYDTRNEPGGVRYPARPWLIATGPASTRLPSSSQAWFVDRRTHACTPARQGTAAFAAAGTAAGAGAA